MSMKTGDSRPNVIVTAPIDATAFESLSRHIHLVTIATQHQGGSLLQTDAAGYLATADVVMCELDVIDEQVLQQAPRLSLIIVCRSNPVNVDLKACADHGVRVITTPGRNADSTADATMALMLAALRNIVTAEQWLRTNTWRGEDRFEPYRLFRGPTLAGRRVGVVGYGQIGSRVVRRLLGFSAHVLVSSRSDYSAQLPAGAEQVSLDRLLDECDVVTLHLPENKNTRGVIGRRELARMRSDALLVNTARASLIDKDALLDALNDGEIAGAALDVFWQEPLPADDPLRSAPHLVLTPHIGGASDDVVSIQSRMAAQSLREWMTTRANLA